MVQSLARPKVCLAVTQATCGSQVRSPLGLEFLALTTSTPSSPPFTTLETSLPSSAGWGLLTTLPREADRLRRRRNNPTAEEETSREDCVSSLESSFKFTTFINPHNHPVKSESLSPRLREVTWQVRGWESPDRVSQLPDGKFSALSETPPSPSFQCRGLGAPQTLSRRPHQGAF